MRVAIVITAAVLAAAAATLACGPDRDDYVDANFAIIDALPTIEGTDRLATKTHRLRESGCEGPWYCETTGYLSEVILRMPGDMTPEEVARFYADALEPQGWIVDVQAERGLRIETGQEFLTGRYHGTFTRGDARININTGADSTGREYGDAYVIVVDHAALQHD
jgi:hypothetical protein